MFNPNKDLSKFLRMRKINEEKGLWRFGTRPRTENQRVREIVSDIAEKVDYEETDNIMYEKPHWKEDYTDK